MILINKKGKTYGTCVSEKNHALINSLSTIMSTINRLRIRLIFIEKIIVNHMHHTFLSLQWIIALKKIYCFFFVKIEQNLGRISG